MPQRIEIIKVPRYRGFNRLEADRKLAELHSFALHLSQPIVEARSVEDDCEMKPVIEEVRKSEELLRESSPGKTQSS